VVRISQPITRARFEQVYEEHLTLVRNVLFNMVGATALDDVTQEVFLRILKALPDLKTHEFIKSWVYRVTINTAIDHVRKRSFFNSPGDDGGLDAIPTPLPSPESLQGTQQMAVLLQQGLSRLEPDHRAVLVLFYFEEKSVTEIQQILGVPEGTVKSRLFQARQHLKSWLAKKGVNYE